MDYQTYQPTEDLSPLIKCYWTLEVPAEYSQERQRIIPDGCIEMAFILGDDIKRFTSETDFLLQPRSMVLGQTMEPFYIQPTGYVNTFAIRFYPYGFANFVTVSIHELANRETPLADLFGEARANELEQKIIAATDASERMAIVEAFFMDMLHQRTTVDQLVKSTVDILLSTNGSVPINGILKEDLASRRQMERKFLKQIGISPKKLGKVIRLQTALKLLLGRDNGSLTRIAYESDYYDQNHFIKDFKEFTGTTPKAFLTDGHMTLSTLFYAND